MKRIIVYRHKDCARCRKFAGVHRFFDWLDRVETSTDDPKTGPLQLGEIAVEDVRTGATFKGVEAVRRICRDVPAYVLVLPFLRIPSIARMADREARGCTDGGCAVPREGIREQAASRT